LAILLQNRQPFPHLLRTIRKTWKPRLSQHPLTPWQRALPDHAQSNLSGREIKCYRQFLNPTSIPGRDPEVCNGPRGGEDKSCSIEVRLKGAPALLVEDTQSDLYVAVDRAAGRIGRTLDRYLARRRQAAVGAGGQQAPSSEETP
jgi:ribosome-associated translation inhibitor RaiA